MLHLVLTSFSTIHNAALDVKLAWCLVCTRWLAVHALCNPDHISEELLHLRKTSCITDPVLLHQISSAFHSFHTAPRATAARRANAQQLVVVWSKQSSSSVVNMSSSSISLRYCKFMLWCKRYVTKLCHLKLEGIVKHVEHSMRSYVFNHEMKENETID